MEIKTERIELDSMEDAAGLFGVLDENISVFEQETGILITVNGDGIGIEGEAENAALPFLVAIKRKPFSPASPCLMMAVIFSSGCIFSILTAAVPSRRV